MSDDHFAEADLAPDSEPSLQVLRELVALGVRMRLLTGEMAPVIDHKYLSTACHHVRHDLCRLVCKFCEVPCMCPCHP